MWNFVIFYKKTVWKRKEKIMKEFRKSNSHFGANFVDKDFAFFLAFRLHIMNFGKSVFPRTTITDFKIKYFQILGAELLLRLLTYVSSIGIFISFTYSRKDKNKKEFRSLSQLERTMPTAIFSTCIVLYSFGQFFEIKNIFLFINFFNSAEIGERFSAFCINDVIPSIGRDFWHWAKILYV